MIGPFYILLSIEGIKHCIKLDVRNQCHCLCGDDLDIDPGVGSWRHFEVFTNWNFNENVFAVATSTELFLWSAHQMLRIFTANQYLTAILIVLQQYLIEKCKRSVVF